MGLEGTCAILLHPLCLSHAEALPFSDSWQCCPTPGKPTTLGYMDFFKRIQVLSSLAGGRKWETSPENWGHASGAHAGEKAKGESEVQVSPERARLHLLGVWVLGWCI